MKDDEKGYVIPTPVDTSGEVKKDDSLLGRERDNIINATNQVNSSIDKDKIIETNNKYKIKKTPKIISFTILVLSGVLIFIVSFYCIKFSKKFIEDGNPTTTTTTSNPLDRATEYWNKDTVRRYIDNDGKVYLFTPRSYEKYVYEISKGEDGIETQMGIYDDETVQLNMDDVYQIKVSNNGLLLDDKEINTSSGEYKYYAYKEGEHYALLIINASAGLLQGLYIQDNSVIDGKYMEYDDRIELTNITTKYIFPKKGNSVLYNNLELTLQN